MEVCRSRSRGAGILDGYQRVYATALSATSTKEAPWYVVPADRKWYRNLAVARSLVQTLEGLELAYPEPEADLEGIVIT